MTYHQKKRFSWKSYASHSATNLNIKGRTREQVCDITFLILWDEYAVPPKDLSQGPLLYVTESALCIIHIVRPWRQDKLTIWHASPCAGNVRQWLLVNVNFYHLLWKKFSPWWYNPLITLSPVGVIRNQYSGHVTAGITMLWQLLVSQLVRSTPSGLIVHLMWTNCLCCCSWAYNHTFRLLYLEGSSVPFSLAEWFLKVALILLLSPFLYVFSVKLANNLEKLCKIHQRIRSHKYLCAVEFSFEGNDVGGFSFLT